MSTAWLSALKMPALRRLSALVGLNMTGNKTTLLTQLASLPPTSSASRILSIDMGIRNLAYCVLDLPAGKRPQVLAWTRTAIPIPESIALQAFAAAAHTLATDLLAEWEPEYVLIERQRWRSAGGTAVQEWTIRVNTIEAMLHSTFYCLHASEMKWDGTVESVDPGRVARLWAPERKGRTTAAQVKKLKKEVVREWLRLGGVVKLGNASVERTAELVAIADTKGATKSDGTKLEAEEKKVDDLADCLLQAMAWRKWQQNRRLLLSGTLPDEMKDITAVRR